MRLLLQEAAKLLSELSDKNSPNTVILRATIRRCARHEY